MHRPVPKLQESPVMQAGTAGQQKSPEPPQGTQLKLRLHRSHCSQEPSPQQDSSSPPHALQVPGEEPLQEVPSPHTRSGQHASPSRPQVLRQIASLPQTPSPAQLPPAQQGSPSPPQRQCPSRQVSEPSQLPPAQQGWSTSPHGAQVPPAQTPLLHASPAQQRSPTAPHETQVPSAQASLVGSLQAPSSQHGSPRAPQLTHRPSSHVSSAGEHTAPSQHGPPTAAPQTSHVPPAQTCPALHAAPGQQG
jgi:hypothetical protein